MSSAVLLPDKISDPLKKWCIEEKSRPDYYKTGMTAEDMLSFATSITSLESTPERLDTMKAVLDDEEPRTWPAIKTYLQKFVARDAGLDDTQIEMTVMEAKEEEDAANAGTGAGAGAGTGAPVRRGSFTRGRAASFRKESAKKPEAAKPSGGESEAVEKERFTRLYKNYMELDFNKNKVKRTGWTKIPSDYKIACCGNSWADLGYILLCFVILYACISLMFYGLLQAYLATDENQELLYICVALLVIAWITLFSVVYAGNRARAREEAQAASTA